MEIFSIVLLVFIGLAIVVAVLVLIKGGSRKLTAQQQRFLNKQWTKIVSESQHNPVQSILDADKLLAYLLEAKGYDGTLGEMLKKGGSLFGNLNDVWTAHKTRNRIAHEIGVSLSSREVKVTLSQFKSAYKDLGAKL
ncbi:hypothetical protein ACFL3C_00575 [Patescibacteria group bacterium]